MKYTEAITLTTHWDFGVFEVVKRSNHLLLVKVSPLDINAAMGIKVVSIEGHKL